MPLRLLLLVGSARAASWEAIVGSFVSIPALDELLGTKWTLTASAQATAAQLQAAQAFVQTPLDELSSAGSGQLYQYAYTGYPVDELASIPPQFSVANVHQSSSAIAEYVMAATLEWTVKLRHMDAALRACTWKTSAPGNNCSHAQVTHRQVCAVTIS